MKRKGFIKQMFGVTADGRVEQLSELHIPAGTRVVQSFLMSTLFGDNDTSFKKVILPSSVKEIEDAAFANIRKEQRLGGMHSEKGVLTMRIWFFQKR